MCVKRELLWFALDWFWFAVCGHVDVSGQNLPMTKKKKRFSKWKSEYPPISAVREAEVQAAWTGQTILQTVMVFI